MICGFYCETKRNERVNNHLVYHKIFSLNLLEGEVPVSDVFFGMFYKLCHSFPFTVKTTMSRNKDRPKQEVHQESLYNFI